ncbi:hypothetical protein NCC78_10385 [Micromonospora phytophila]|uniref:hypothetical protein n=1 Tax=Micromonospora phytophila TaxID=709888 RepID=UPI00202DEF39|nr:hypothetical protein [Micromonospora phytophila]MCM0675094.1 hypothetical protein [Micromonospora phytophila]
MAAVPDFPDFDQTVVAVASTLGLSSIILAVIALLFFLQSWAGPLKLAAKGAGIAADTVRGAYVATSKVRGGQRAIAISASTLVVLSQLLALRLCLVGGNLMFLANTNGGPWWEPFTTGVRNDPWSLLALETPWYLRWDGFVPWYMAISAGLIVLSYVYSARSPYGGGLPWMSLLMGGPGALIGAFGAVVVALLLLILVILGAFGLMVSGTEGFVSLFETLSPHFLIFGGCLVVGGTYWAACHYSLRGSRLVIQLWTIPRLPVSG